MIDRGDLKIYLNVQVEALGYNIHVWTGPEAVDLPASPLLILSAYNPHGNKTPMSVNRNAQKQLNTYLQAAGLIPYKTLWPTQNIQVGAQCIVAGCAVLLKAKDQIAEMLHVARMFHQSYLYRLSSDDLMVVNSLTGDVEGQQSRLVGTFNPEPEVVMP